MQVFTGTAFCCPATVKRRTNIFFDTTAVIPLVEATCGTETMFEINWRWNDQICEHPALSGNGECLMGGGEVS